MLTESEYGPSALRRKRPVGFMVAVALATVHRHHVAVWVHEDERPPERPVERLLRDRHSRLHEGVVQPLGVIPSTAPCPSPASRPRRGPPPAPSPRTAPARWRRPRRSAAPAAPARVPTAPRRTAPRPRGRAPATPRSPVPSLW